MHSEGLSRPGPQHPHAWGTVCPGSRQPGTPRAHPLQAELEAFVGARAGGGRMCAHGPHLLLGPALVQGSSQRRGRGGGCGRGRGCGRGHGRGRDWRPQCDTGKPRTALSPSIHPPPPGRAHPSGSPLLSPRLGRRNISHTRPEGWARLPWPFCVKSPWDQEEQRGKVTVVGLSAAHEARRRTCEPARDRAPLPTAVSAFACFGLNAALPVPGERAPG